MCGARRVCFVLLRVNCQNIPILSIPGFNVYTQFELEVDERFGLYAGCNPDPGTGIFSCRAFGEGCWHDDPAARHEFGGVCHTDECYCAAYVHEAVGRSVCNMCEANASWHHDTPMWRQVEALGRLLNGSWFSTQTAGECAAGERVGKDCWWRIVRQVRNVNASCVSDRIVQAVTDHNPQCFAGCSAPPQRSSPCFISCLFDTLVGSGAVSEGSGGMSKQEVLAPFLQAFASADPRCAPASERAGFEPALHSPPKELASDQHFTPSRIRTRALHSPPKELASDQHFTPSRIRTSIFHSLPGPCGGRADPSLPHELPFSPGGRGRDGGCPEVPPCPTPCVPPVMDASRDAAERLLLGGRYAI